MKKTSFSIKGFCLSILCLLLVSVFSVQINAAKFTTNVNIVGDIQTTNIWEGVTMDRAYIQSPRAGALPVDNAVYDWDMVNITASKDSDVEVVTWGLEVQNGYKAATTVDIAKNYELHNPGYTVLAAINGDFFSNTGYTTSNGTVYDHGTGEPINTWVSEGRVVKKGVLAHPHHNVIGFTADNEYIYHIGTFYDENLNSTWDDGGVDTSLRGSNMPTFTDLPVFHVNDSEYTAYLYTQFKELQEEGVNIVWAGNYDIDTTGYDVYKFYVDRFSRADDGFQGKYFVGYYINEPYDIEYRGLYLEGRSTGLVEETHITTVEENWFYVITKEDLRDVLNVRNTTAYAQYDLTGDWANVENAMGTVHPFILNGQSTGYVNASNESDNYLNSKRPKTIIAFNDDGEPMLVFVGPGPLSNTTSSGPSSVEVAEILHAYNTKDAFCLDGGGSSSLIYKNKAGEFVELNHATDPGGIRAIGNAILFVIKDEIVLDSYEATHATFAYAEDSRVTSATLNFNGQEYDFVDGEVTVTGLTKLTSYSYTFSYEYIDDNGNLKSATTMPKTFKTKANDTNPPVQPVEPVYPSEFVVQLTETEDAQYEVALGYTNLDELVQNVEVFAVIDGEEVLLENEELIASAAIESLKVTFEHSGKTYEFELADGEFELSVIPYEGEEDPINPDEEDNENQGGSSMGGMSCSFGGYYVSAFIGACALLLLVSKKK